MTSKEAVAIFPDSVCKKLNINFPVVKVYNYCDKSGKYYCILSEDRNEITADENTICRQIKAVTVKAVHGTFSKLWEINDKIIANNNDENSIWFWTKYIEFKDIDNDGLIDPVTIYGTVGANGYDDGRIKFIIYYRNKKVAIRHQNGVLDFERETQVDRAFYDLPKSLQISIRQKMELMTTNNHAIFPAGWRTEMENKATNINERSQRIRR